MAQRRRELRTWAASCAALTLLAAAAAARADLEVFAESGDRVVGDVGPSIETDTVRLRCAAGDVLEASVRAKGRAVTVRLRDVDGTVLAESAGKTVVLASAALAADGEVSVEITSPGAARPARYRALVRCGDSSGTRRLNVRSASIGAGTTAVEAFSVPRGGTEFTAARVADIAGLTVYVGPRAVRAGTTLVVGTADGLRPAAGDLVSVGPAVLVGPLPRFFDPAAHVALSIPYRPVEVTRTVQVLVAGLDGRVAPVRDVTADPGNFAAGFATTRLGVFQVFDGTSSIGPVTGGNQLTAFDALPGEAMGDVALDGPLAVVGVPHHSVDVSGAIVDTGAAYVFERVPAGGWQQIAQLVPDDPARTALVGTKVAVDGSRIAVSGRRFGQGGGSSGVGAVWIFDRTDGVFEQTAELLGTFVTFGYDIALQGDRLAVSVLVTSGAVQVFEFDGAVWALDDTLSGGFGTFGMSVALDGDALLVGAPSNSVFSTGTVYAYSRASGRWLADGTLTPTGGGTFQNFGVDVALQGGRAAIGAPFNVIPTTYGSVYVFERVSGQWTQAARIDNPRGTVNEGFGTCVALEGSRILIGAPDSDAVAPDGGITYLAHQGTGSWISVTPLAPAGVTVGDRTGSAIAFDGNRVAIVAPGADKGAENAGVVTVIDVTGR